jgi:hypothetical protein
MNTLDRRSQTTTKASIDLGKSIQAVRRRPISIRNMAVFELCGALGCIVLLCFVSPHSRDFVALIVEGVWGLLVAYGLWTLKFWAFWCTVIFETSSILYEAFLVSSPAYRNMHIVFPVFGILMSLLTLAYLFLDRSIKPAFRRIALQK